MTVAIFIAYIHNVGTLDVLSDWSLTLFTTIFTTIICTVLLAAGGWMFKSRWLYVIAPKLHMITPMSDGQIVSLSIHNAGLAAEEDIRLTMRPSCRFELVATSKSTVTLTNKILSLPKLSRMETVTVLLLVEGRQFAEEDIESIESKATHGTIVASKEKAVGAWQHVVILPALLLFLALPFLFGTFVGAEMKQSLFGYAKDQFELLESTKQLAGFKVKTREKYAYEKLKGALSDSRISVVLEEVVRRGDVLTLSVKIQNRSGIPLKIGASMSGTAGKGNVDFSDYHIEDFALATGEDRLVKLKVFLPESTTVKMIEGNYSFKSLEDGDLTVEQVINF